MLTATALLNETRTPLLGGNPDAHYLVPQDAAFGGDFMPGEDLERIAGSIIDKYPANFGFLRDVSVVYLWKRKGGKSKGKVTLGRCVKTSGLVRYFGGSCDFAIWIAADTARDYRLTSRQMEAAVFHEMCHISEDDDVKAVAVEHEFAGFVSELQTYGPWTADLKLAVDVSAQIPLFEYEYPEEED